MDLKHGNTPQDRYARIEAMAERIYRLGWRSEANPTGTTREELRDANDINTSEDAEIEAAKELAAKWATERAPTS
jgi:hypothetical protein